VLYNMDQPTALYLDRRPSPTRRHTLHDGPDRNLDSSPDPILLSWDDS